MSSFFLLLLLFFSTSLDLFMVPIKKIDEKGPVVTYVENDVASFLSAMMSFTLYLLCQPAAAMNSFCLSVAHSTNFVFFLLSINYLFVVESISTSSSSTSSFSCS